MVHRTCLRGAHTLQGPTPSPPQSQKDTYPIATPIRLQCLPADTSSYVFVSRKKCPTTHPVPQNAAGQRWEDSYGEMTWPPSWGSPRFPCLWSCPPNNQSCLTVSRGPAPVPGNKRKELTFAGLLLRARDRATTFHLIVSSKEPCRVDTVSPFHR